MEKLRICQECGAICCKSGPIVLTVFDISRLCKYLNVSVDEFVEGYVQVMSGEDYAKFFNLEINNEIIHKLRKVIYITLKLRSDGSCIFLENNLCKVYSARPSTCRVFPLRVGGIVKKCPLSSRKELLKDEEKEYPKYLQENFKHAMIYMKCLDQHDGDIDNLVKCLINHVP